MMDYRQQRQYYRSQRRAYRRQMRGPFGGLGGLIMLIVILSIIGNHLFWFALPFLFVVVCILVARGLFGAAMNNQQQYNPPYQQDQTIYTYQPPQEYQQPQEDPPAYQPYTQGYTPQQPTQPAGIYQESEPQPEQYAEQQQQTQQYEEPLTMYPQE